MHGRQTHAILGAGGVGGFVAAILAHAGEHVVLLLRADTFARHPKTLALESPLGDLVAPVETALTLEGEVNILWIATKATQLGQALEAAPRPGLARTVVPLLNGVDHVALLRSRFAAHAVVPGTIAGELERTAPGRIVHRSPFANFVFSDAGLPALARTADLLTRFGCACRFEADELTLLWRKLVMLAPMALNTTVTGLGVGELWADPERSARFETTVREACAVARALGAHVDEEVTLRVLRDMPATLRSSMQKDVAGGRVPELDAIAGPILRGGEAHGIRVPVTTDLAATIEAAL